MRRMIIVACSTAAIVSGGATAATGSPPAPEVVDLTCSNGESYTVEVRGNGGFTPGHVVGSTGVLIPVAFGPFELTAELPDGTIIEQEDPLIERKGKGEAYGRQRQTVTCTYSDTETLTEEVDGFPAGTVITFSGTVTGLVRGMR